MEREDAEGFIDCLGKKEANRKKGGGKNKEQTQICAKSHVK
jgi:hypothetical protein